MSEGRFKIVFSGALLPGVDINIAKQKVAKLFKSDVAAIEPLFKGQNVTLKRDLSHGDAKIYLEALNQTGIDARLEPDPSSRQPETPSPQPASVVIPPSATPTSQPAEPVAADAWKSPTTHAETVSTSPYTPPQSAVGEALPEFGELKFYTVHGRIGRLRYLAWTLALILMATLVGGAVAGALIGSGGQVLGMLLLAGVALTFSYLHITISVQRMHDLGWSGWLWLLNLLPFVYMIFPLLIAILPGNPGANRYGAPPPPNSTAVKVLSWSWIAVLVLSFIIGLAGGA